MLRQLPQDFVFYADESGISQDRFTVVGGLSMRKDTVTLIYEAIDAFRAQHQMNAELKWSKISNQKVLAYKALVDLFFDLNNANKVQFHSVIFDNHMWNHNKYNKGDPDIGLSKLYYDLILHKFIKKCGRDGKTLYACVDHRNSSTSLEDVRKMLNNAAARDFGFHHKPIAQLFSRDSKRDPILQLNDVILGAVYAMDATY